MIALLLTIAILALLLALAAPGLVALSRPKAARFAAPFYLVLLLGLGAYHVGLPSFGDAPLFAGERPLGGGADGSPAGLCEQALVQSERGGLIIDRSNPARVTVDRELWGQIPQQVKDALASCLQGAAPPGANRPPVEIVETARP